MISGRSDYDFSSLQLGTDWNNLQGEIWLFLTKNTVTGYESICLSGKHPISQDALGKSWIACAGGNAYPILELNL